MSIRAAGGVLWRLTAAEHEVAVIHRRRYDDWTLPKGKCKRGESELRAAVREIHEETGARVAVGRRLPTTEYSVSGQAKTVTFWAMRQLSGAFAASDEVDQLRWLPVAAARAVLSYPGERDVLDGLLPLADAVVVLVRHAKAGKRAEWAGEDRARPLEAAGWRQGAALASELAVFAPTRILAADLVRCRQTVLPLADQLGMAVADAPAFADARAVEAPAETLRVLCVLAEPDTVSVVCSQGETIPMLVRRLTGRNGDTGKGAFWVLSFAGGTLLSADQYGPAGDG